MNDAAQVEHLEREAPRQHVGLEQPLERIALEEIDDAGRRVEEVEGVLRRRCVEDDEIVCARAVDLVELLHGSVLMGAGQHGGEVLVDAVGEYLLACLQAGRPSLDEIVEGALDVRHQRPQRGRRLYPMGRELLRGDLPRDIADAIESQGVGKAPGRIDGHYQSAQSRDCCCHGNGC